MMEAVCNGKIDPKIIRQVMQNNRNNSSNSAAKFFNRSKLDYPNNETSKASRKYVKAMRHLSVCQDMFCGRIFANKSLGLHSKQHFIQQADARFITQNLRLRSKTAHHCKRSAETSMVQRIPDR